MLENGVKILELRLLELACGVNIYQELSREDVNELLEINKDKIIEKCYQICRKEMDTLRDEIIFDNKANELDYVKVTLDRCYRERSLQIIEVVEWVCSLRIYC